MGMVGAEGKTDRLERSILVFPSPLSARKHRRPFGPRPRKHSGASEKCDANWPQICACGARHFGRHAAPKSMTVAGVGIVTVMNGPPASHNVLQ